jgi:hypothetical protein
MSSGFKKQLLQSQAYSGTTKKGDVVVLPPDSEDVILVTKCSGKDSGVVKATLEHSPDTEDANFSIVQSEKVSISAATTGWGNLKYIDTTATGTGSDYKNKTVRANNLSGQSNDIFHSKMTKDDPWTISTWIKSSSQPATTNTANFDVTKYVYTKIKDTYNAANKNRAIYVQNPWTYSDWASSTNWSISMWLKYEGDDASGIFGMIQHGIRGIEISKNSTSLSITHGLPSTDPKVTIPATLNDGNWHNVTITHSNSDTYETIGTDPSTCNTLVYLNGALVTPSSGGTATATVTYGNDSSNPVYLNLGSDKNGDVGASSTFLHVSTWTKTLSSTEVNSILGANDKPKDLTGQSNLACWLPLGDGYDTSNPSTVDTVVGSSAKFWDMSGNGRHALPHQADTAGGGVTPSNSDVGWDQTDSPVEGVTNLGTSENVYIAPSTTSTDTYLPVLFSTGSSKDDGGTDVFGNGMRMSFTKKLKTDATWDATGAQTSRFLLSFDGFEDTAAYFLGYNTTFTRPLHPKTGAEDASADLLDGEWHNIIVSYRGGAPGTAVNPHDYIAVCFDGKQMTTTDCVEKTSTVTFINDHFRYTDVSEDLRGTFFLSAGDPFVVANTNSKYAFQGGFDETSLHDDSWQLSSSPSTGWTSGGFNTMKPNTIYGIDSTRNSANDAGSPYDLKNPSSIGHPGPTGNSYLEPSASAVGGGLQAYYRWGDTTGDCSTSIHDVQSAIDNVTDRDLAVLYGSISAGDATDENSAAWDTAVDTVAEGGIEVASTSIPGSAGFALENVQITCADGLQFFRVNAPKLSNLRIKWTGAGTATSVEASLHYRRRKK